MGELSCNKEASESGGKDLLLKICSEVDVDVAIGTADDPTAILLADHNLQVGDLVRVSAEELGTVDDVDSGRFYMVVEVVPKVSFSIAETPKSAKISFTHAITGMEIQIFRGIGGLRTESKAFASDAIENSNRGTNQWRKLVDGAGMRQISVSGDGVYNNEETFDLMEDRAYRNLLTCLAFVEVRTGKIYNGCFKITSVEATSNYDGEATFSMSAVSSGEVEIKKLVESV
jgi:predicted secreted protein